MLNPQTRRLIAAFATVILLAALALPVPAAAQEAEDASSAGGVQGVTALLLMVGLGAVILVGLFYVAENQAAARRDHESREE